MGVQGIVVKIQMHRLNKSKIFVPVRNRFAALLARFRIAREASIRLVSAFDYLPIISQESDKRTSELSIIYNKWTKFVQAN